MEKKSVRIAVYVLAVLMLSTGILYLTLAYDENKSHQEEVQASATTNEREAGEAGERESGEAGEQAKTTSESNGFGDIGEIVFFFSSRDIIHSNWIDDSKEERVQ